jgi:hypothetical protein
MSAIELDKHLCIHWNKGPSLSYLFGFCGSYSSEILENLHSMGQVSSTSNNPHKCNDSEFKLA